MDFLADADDADRLHDVLLSLGYRCVHRSEDAANYLRDDERLDLLYAHRPAARRLLAEAAERETVMGPLRVIGVEGLIGLKLQALVNNPSRPRDLADIRELLRVQRDRLNMAEVREYFAYWIAQRCWMDYSTKSRVKNVDGVHAPLPRRRVPDVARTGEGDLSDWVELMEVVEMLCPVWPDAPVGKPDGYRL
ncbi:MAG: nucleotidyl transferase AbiEii/AbiGii toxin family protein [Rhodanobacteraceae bacterium]